MSPLLRIGAFAVAVAVVFAVATLAGAALDPGVEPVSGGHEEEGKEMDAHTGEAHQAIGGALPGLAAAQDGYRLEPARTALAPGADVEYSFRIVGPDGETVRNFEVEHERRMHLIIVGRDFTGFQHLHPRQGEDGSWHVKADLRRAGTYRVFADFSTAGRSLTLAADLFVAGEFVPRPLPAPEDVASAGDGYRVRIASEQVSRGAEPIRFTVTHRGDRVDSVQPYLGADGHLVALREHDQAFLHTHPQGEPGGSQIDFAVEYPTPGRYRLFLQFKHDGVVRTAEFTREVGSDRGVGAVEPGGRSDRDARNGSSGSDGPDPHQEEPGHGH